jgi:arginyl-tRNA synthetase
MNILRILQEKLHAALSGLVDDPGKYSGLVKAAQNPQFGDYQANCAMPLKNVLGKNPQQIAKDIVGRLDLGDMLELPEIAGPGFINLRIKPDWLAKQAQEIADDDRLGVAPAEQPRVYVVDYSSPNVAKPLHVGHLRSTIIGDSLARLLRFLGHKVIADNHLGDWGTQFGILLYGYKHFRDDAAFKADPVRELTRLYLHMRQLTKGAEDEDDKPADPVAKQYADACREETAKLHAGDTENVALWRQFMPAAMAEIERIYSRLDVRFDEQHGESFYNPMLAAVVDDLLAKGLAEQTNGAIGIFPVPRKEDSVPALVRKRDGAFTYMTSDLATIRYRVTEWQPAAMLYVVDARQAFHFKQLFDAARRWGYDRVELEHVAFGSVLGPDRKPLKTREGGAPELGALLDEAVEHGAERYGQSRAERIERGEDVPEISEPEEQQIAETVGLGAVKYADLSQHRTTDYVFAWDKMLATDGNTATYMQYAYARCRSIFRKGDVDVQALRKSKPLPPTAHPAERALTLQLLRFEETLTAAAAEYLPHLLTAYLWDLAKSYSTFFHDCPVLKAETSDLRIGRLLLCDLTARTIQMTLGLLGIRTVERM